MRKKKKKCEWEENGRDDERDEKGGDGGRGIRTERMERERVIITKQRRRGMERRKRERK